MAGINNSNGDNVNGFHSNGPNFFNPNGARHPNNSPGSKDVDFMDLQYFTHLLWDRKGVLISLMVLGVLVAGVAAYLKMPIYKSNGSIMITESKNQYSYAGSDLGNLITNSYGIGIGSSIMDELEILRSRSLSLEVADTLLEKRVMKNGKQYPMLFESYPEDSTLAERSAVAAQLREKLSFNQEDEGSNLIKISFESPSPVEAAEVVNLTIKMYSQVSTRQNRRSANAAVSFLENERGRIENRLNNAEQQLQQYMDQNEIVQVDAQTQSMISQAAQLEQRRQEARTNLVTVNSALEQYQEQLNKIKPGLADQYANALGANMERLQYQLAELKTERRQMYAENPGLRDAANHPTRLKQINRRIADLEEEIRSLTTELLGKSDEYLGFLSGSGEDIIQNVSNLNQKIIQLKVEQQQYQSQVDVLTEQINQINQTFEDLPENMTSLARLKRNVKINEQLYVTVSEQYAEMSLWQQTQFGQGQLVDGGYPPGAPVEPNTRLYLLVGLMLGTIAGIGFIFVQESFNNTIDGVEKLKEYKAPMLAVVPDMNSFIKKEYDNQKTASVRHKKVLTSLITLLNPINPVSESFRGLEANIMHANPDNHIQSLMITSTTKGEGKTTIAANLGVVMAESDQKVVVVDTDLRRPQLHSMFQLDRSPGIVDVLFDNGTMRDAVRKTMLPNLFVLPAGNRPPNPPAVTKSSKFLDLLVSLEQDFDRIIFDTSPYGIIKDSSTFMDITDGLIVVTRFGQTRFGELEHTFNSLNRVEAKVIGTVLNGFNPDRNSDYYYGYNYYKNFYRDYEEYEDTGYRYS